MDIPALGLFLVSAVAVLGSPGPGIAALLVVGRERGFAGGLGYYAGLQLGLAVAAAVSATGLDSLLRLYPAALRWMTIAAAVYLVYLAYKISTARVGAAKGKPMSVSPAAGLLLGITNPKAYVAFVSLLSSRPLLPHNLGADVPLKWMLCVVVIIVVDLAWLLVGARLNQAALLPKAERMLNVILGAAIVGAAVANFL